MRRRELIAGLGGAVVWPLAARAQQGERMRRIGLLIGPETEPETLTHLALLREGLARLDWTEGRNLRIDIRYSAINPNRMRADAEELVSLAPEVIVTSEGYTPLKPVTLLSGRAMFFTIVLPSAILPPVKTIGIVRVSLCIAIVEGPVAVPAACNLPRYILGHCGRTDRV